MIAEKIKLRSDIDLNDQNHGLVKLCEVLRSINVPYYLSNGALLGAIREKDFIRWDWDVQINLKTEDVYSRKDELRAAFENAGFKIIRMDHTYKNLKYLLGNYNTLYELTAWHLKGNMRYRRDWKLPSKFFDSPQFVKLRGHNYPVMSPPEEYLSYVYGDWKTPKRTDDKKVYYNSSYFRHKRLWRFLLLFSVLKEKIAERLNLSMS